MEIYFQTCTIQKSAYLFANIGVIGRSYSKRCWGHESSGLADLGCGPYLSRSALQWVEVERWKQYILP